MRFLGIHSRVSVQVPYGTRRSCSAEASASSVIVRLRFIQKLRFLGKNLIRAHMFLTSSWTVRSTFGRTTVSSRKRGATETWQRRSGRFPRGYRWFVCCKRTYGPTASAGTGTLCDASRLHGLASRACLHRMLPSTDLRRVPMCSGGHADPHPLKLKLRSNKRSDESYVREPCSDEFIANKSASSSFADCS